METLSELECAIHEYADLLVCTVRKTTCSRKKDLPRSCIV